MGLKQSVSSVGTTGLAIAALSGVWLAPPLQNTSAAASPQILTGLLHRPGGAALDGAEVQISVTRKTAYGSLETPIGSTTSHADGTFTVLGALGKAPVTYNPDGTMQLQIDVSAPGLSKTYFVNARPPASGHPDWTWGSVADDDVIKPGVAGLARSAATASLAQAEAHQPLEGIDLTAVRVGPTARKSDLGLSSSGGCSWVSWHTESSSYDRFRNIPVQHLTVRNRTLQDYKWYTTKETQMGIAVDEDITTSGGTYAGGMSYEQGAAKTSSMNPAFHTKDWNGHVNTGWRYRRQRMLCSEPTGYHDQMVTVATNKHRYVPWNWTLRNGAPSDSHHFTCRSSVPSQFTVTSATSTWQKLSGYFSIWGVKLSASQKATTGSELTMKKRAGFKRFFICGNGSDPGSSGAIWEKQV